MRIRSPRTVAATVLAAVALALTAAPAQASGGGYYTPPERYHFVGDFESDCASGYVIEYDYKGVYSVRNVRGSDGQAFLAADTFRFSETWRDPVTGELVMRLRGAIDFREVSARFVPLSQVPDDLVPEEGLVGPVYEFTATETGWETVFDGEGDIAYRTVGLVVYRSLFDTLGDSQPGGTALDDRVVKVVGPHPLLDRDYCDVADELAA